MKAVFSSFMLDFFFWNRSLEMFPNFILFHKYSFPPSYLVSQKKEVSDIFRNIRFIFYAFFQKWHFSTISWVKMHSPSSVEISSLAHLSKTSTYRLWFQATFCAFNFLFVWASVLPILSRLGHALKYLSLPKVSCFTFYNWSSM